MMRATVFLIGSLLLVADLSAQVQVEANTAFLFEKYEFDPGLAYSSVAQTSVPVTIAAPMGRIGTLTVSSGFTRIELTASGDANRDDRTLSGIVDNEARLVLNLVPGRLNLLLTAVAPTGIEGLKIDEGPFRTALSSQVIGFSTTTLGTGGAAGAGIAGAIPVGTMALGVAGTYTHALAYNPVLGQDYQWKPGGELRVRAGLEGTVGENGYLRVAGVFARRQKDKLGDEERGAIGNRIHAYVALNQGMGSGAMTLYAFNSYRSAPQVEPTFAGAVILPKGNLLVLGAKAAIPVGGETRFMPRVEFRRLTEASREGLGDGAMEAAGSTIRIGADLRKPLNSRFAMVLEANGLFGNAGAFDGGEVGVHGFRGGVHLEIR